MAGRYEDDTNPFAAPDSDLEPGGYERTVTNFEYANFGQRFVAAFVDNIIMQIGVFAVSFGIGIAGASAGADETMLEVMGGLSGLVIGWLYYALQESSEARATLGKKMMGILVVDMTGDRISFGQATGRHFGKIVSGILCLAGYIMQPFTEKKQALHDIMAGTLVVKA